MSKKTKIKTIGLIVEDDSDFDSFKRLIGRITGKSNLKFLKSACGGCGKLRRKAVSYADNLHRRGCEMIIIIHDLDRNVLASLKKELDALAVQSPAKHNFVCIPIEEIEGWFLSDPEGIQKALALKKTPKITGNPEEIKDPKGKIRDIVIDCSEKTKIYLNTKHNEKLSETISLDKMKAKCPSFQLLCDYINSFDY